MSDLQARLAKLRASNQTIKAVADRIDSAKVLASGVNRRIGRAHPCVCQRCPAPGGWGLA